MPPSRRSHAYARALPPAASRSRGGAARRSRVTPTPALPCRPNLGACPAQPGPGRCKCNESQVCCRGHGQLACESDLLRAWSLCSARLQPLMGIRQPMLAPLATAPPRCLRRGRCQQPRLDLPTRSQLQVRGLRCRTCVRHLYGRGRSTLGPWRLGLFHGPDSAKAATWSPKGAASA